MTLPITPSFSIHTDFLYFQLKPSTTAFHYRIDGKEVTAFYPEELDFWTHEGQQRGRWLVATVLRVYAKRMLVPALRQLALEKGILLKRITIKDIKTRWGSCSSLGNINLNLWLLLLPSEFILYVMFHELGHLKEMNHSKAFWEYVDKLYGKGAGYAKQLDKRMTQHHKELLETWKVTYQRAGIPLV